MPCTIKVSKEANWKLSCFNDKWFHLLLLIHVPLYIDRDYFVECLTGFD